MQNSLSNQSQLLFMNAMGDLAGHSNLYVFGILTGFVCMLCIAIWSNRLSHKLNPQSCTGSSAMINKLQYKIKVVQL